MFFKHNETIWYRKIFLSLFFSILFSVTFSQNASGSPWLCDEAASAAAYSFEVPADVMHAITRVETGRLIEGDLRPWPWSVNLNGQANWFDSKIEALHFVFEKFRSGNRSFDAGCFQINYKWHGSKFSSIEDMFDPEISARYAAAFLRKLFEKHGNWREAVGAYHSKTPDLAERYLVNFDHVWDEMFNREFPTDAVSNDPPGRSERRGKSLGSLVSFSKPGYVSIAPLFGSLGN